MDNNNSSKSLFSFLTVYLRDYKPWHIDHKPQFWKISELDNSDKIVSYFLLSVFMQKYVLDLNASTILVETRQFSMHVKPVEGMNHILGQS